MMRKLDSSFLLLLTSALLFCCAGNAQAQAAMDPPHDPQGCLSCHDMSAFDQENLIPNDPPYVPLNMDDTLYNSICLTCHNGITATEAHVHSSLTTSNKYGDWSVGCSVCHNQHVQQNAGGLFIRDRVDLNKIDITPAKTGTKTVIFNGPTGLNSYADGVGAVDGICEVCHTQTTHWRNDGTLAGLGVHAGLEGSDCMGCHGHTGGFEADCGSCHDFPPGALVFNPGTTGSATAGAHVEHYTNQNINCDSCHFENFSNNEHNNGGPLSVSIGFGTSNPIPQGGDYDGQAGVAYDATATTPPTTVSGPTGAKTCSILYCHGNYPGSGLAASPVWDNAATGDCGTCHAAANSEGLFPASGSHERHAENGNIAGNPPGAFQWNRGYECTLCHTGIIAGTGPASYTIADTTKHVSGYVDWAFDTSDSRLNADSVYNTAAGTETPTDGVGPNRLFNTCNNIYCHSIVQTGTGGSLTANTADYKTPTWGSDVICGDCHKHDDSHAPRSTGPMDSGSHTEHLAYQFTTSFPANKCDLCHEYGAMGPTAVDCSSCHIAGERTDHADGEVDVKFYAAYSGAGTYAGTPAPGDGYSTCSNTYCHDDGTAVATTIVNANVSPAWGTAGPLACDSCHDGTATGPSYVSGSPKANSHNTHVSQGLTCDTCHFTTTNNGTTIADKTTHLNRAYDVDPGTGITFNYTYNAAGGSCDTSYCHGAGTPQWGGTVNCGDCHTVNNTLADSHSTHYGLAAAGDWNSNNNSTAAVYAFNCQNCHDNAENPTGVHGDGAQAAPQTADIFFDTATVGYGTSSYTPGALGGTDNGFQWSQGTCDNTYCHSNGTVVSTGIISANTSPAWGSAGPLACSSCHEGTATGPTYANGTPKANSHALHIAAGSTCDDCHFATTTDSATVADRSKHINRTYDVDPGTGNSFTYTYNASGGSCATVNCHSGANGVWGKTHNVSYNPLVDLSQVSMPGDNPCADCHTDNSDGAGTPLDSWTDILGEHLNDCATCHGYTVGTTPPAATVIAVIAGGGPATCVTCHTPKLDPAVSSDHGGHDDTQFGWDSNCQNCHGAGAGAEAVVSNIHSNDCDLCHTGGTYNATTNGAGPVANGIDGDATLAEGDAGTWASTCTTCHAIGGGSNNAGTLGGVHHDNKTDGVVAEADCAACHTVLNHEGDHSARISTVANSCGTCHTNTAGGGAGVGAPVNAGDDMIHDGCTTCHGIAAATARDGFLLDQPTANVNGYVGAMPNGGAGTNNGGGDCTVCHTTYFNTHTHSHAATVIVNTASGSNTVNCIGCHITATAGNGPFITGSVHAGSGCATCHDLDATPTGALIGSAATADINGIAADAAYECGECHAAYFSGHDHGIDNAQDAGTFEHDVAMGADQAGTQSCNECHIVGGALFGDNWDGSDDINTLHTSSCGLCHNSARNTDMGGGYTDVPDVIATGVAVSCLDCHASKAAVHMNHITYDPEPNGVGAIEESIQCTTCHTGGGTPGSLTDANMMAIHNISGQGCGTCHVAAGGSGPLVDRSGGGTYASQAKNYETVNTNGGECIDCHDAYGTNFATSHMVVDHSGIGSTASCASCHTGDKITSAITHNGSCTTCHSNTTTDGTLNDGTGAASPNGATVVGDASGHDITVTSACADCHATRGADFTAHLVADHSGVGSTASCASCHTGDKITSAITHNNTCSTCHTNTTNDGSLLDGTGAGSPFGATAAGDASGHVITAASACADCHATRGADFTAHLVADHSGVGSTASCASCHTGDKITSAITHNNTCSTCHTNITNDGSLLDGTGAGSPKGATVVGDASGHDITVVSVCADCHAARGTDFTSHLTKDHSGVSTTASCVSCHTGNKITSAITHKNACTTCHTNTTNNGSLVDGTGAGSPFGATSAGDASGHVITAASACADCHATRGADFTAHLVADHSGVGSTASCASCHTGNILSDVRTHGDGATATCTLCHANTTNNGSLLDGTTGGTLGATSAGNASGHVITAASACADCHTTRGTAFNSHAVKDHSGMTATASCASCHTGDKINSPLTHNFACGWCHADVFGTDGSLLDGTTGGAQGATSVGDATGHDITVASTCAACHATRGADFTAHLVADHSGVGSTASCASCHTGDRLSSTLTHNNTCTTCHANTTTDGSLLDGTGAGSPNGATVVGDASGHVITAASACADCHATRGANFTAHLVKDHSGLASTATVETNAQSNDCNDCHSGPVADVVLADEHNDTCVDCHNNTTTDGSLVDGAANAGSYGGTGTNVGDATGHTLGSSSQCIDCHTANYFSNTSQHTSNTHSVAIDGDTSGGQSCSTASCHQGQSENWANILARHDLSATTADVCHVCHDSTRNTNIQAPRTSVQDVITFNTGTANIVSCLECHSDKSASHGGHDATHFGGDAQCTVCHTIPGTGVVAGLHSGNCDLCHVGGVYNASSEGVGPDANLDGVVDGDAGGANGAAGAGTPFDPSVYTCLDCHNAVGDPTGNIDPTTIGGIHHDTTPATGGFCIDCHKPDVGQGASARTRAALDIAMPRGLACNWCHLYWGGGNAGEGGGANGYTVSGGKVQIYSLDWDPNANRAGVTDTVNAPAVKTALASHAVSEVTNPPISDFAACFACHGASAATKGGGYQVVPYHGFGQGYQNDSNASGPQTANQINIYSYPTINTPGTAASAAHTDSRHPGWMQLGGLMASLVNLNKGDGKGFYDANGSNPKKFYDPDNAQHDSGDFTYLTTFDVPWDSFGAGTVAAPQSRTINLGTWYGNTAVDTTVPTVPLTLP